MTAGARPFVHLRPAPVGQGRTLRFEGEAHGAETSFFAVDVPPGAHVGQHVHPYPETWVVIAGRVRLRAGGEEATLGPGEIVVVPAGTPHGFTAEGEARLVMTCIHPRGRMEQTDLE